MRSPKKVCFSSNQNLWTLATISRMKLTNLQWQKLALSGHVITKRHIKRSILLLYCFKPKAMTFQSDRKVLTMRKPLLSMCSRRKECLPFAGRFERKPIYRKRLDRVKIWLKMNAKLAFTFLRETHKRKKKKKISLGFRPSNQVFEKTKLSASDNPSKTLCISFSVSERLRIWSGRELGPKGRIWRGAWWVKLGRLHTHLYYCASPENPLCFRHFRFTFFEPFCWFFLFTVSVGFLRFYQIVSQRRSFARVSYYVVLFF